MEKEVLPIRPHVEVHYEEIKHAKTPYDVPLMLTFDSLDHMWASARHKDLCRRADKITIIWYKSRS